MKTNFKLHNRPKTEIEKMQAYNEIRHYEKTGKFSGSKTPGAKYGRSVIRASRFSPKLIASFKESLVKSIIEGLKIDNK